MCWYTCFHGYFHVPNSITPILVLDARVNTLAPETGEGTGDVTAGPPPCALINKWVPVEPNSEITLLLCSVLVRRWGIWIEDTQEAHFGAIENPKYPIPCEPPQKAISR